MNVSSPARSAAPKAQSPDRIRPVAHYARHDNAPFVRLSPHKGIKNAELIYEAIRYKKSKELIRGDFTKSSEPIVYFPNRPKKKIGCLQGEATTADNIKADRKEFANFIQSIVSTAQRAGMLDKQGLKVLLDLNAVCAGKQTDDRDFTVGDIRDALGVLSKISIRQTAQKFAAAHISPLKLQSPKISPNELQEFADMDLQSSSQLINQMLACDGKADMPQVILAVVEMKALVRKYLNTNSGRKISFPDLLRREGVSQQLQLFARRWSSMAKVSDLDKVFADAPWVGKVDLICGLITKQARRKLTISATTDFNDLVRGSARSSRLKDVLPPLPKVPSPSTADHGVESRLHIQGQEHDSAESNDVLVGDSETESSRLSEFEKRDLGGEHSANESVAPISGDKALSLSSAEFSSLAESSFSIHLSLSGELLEQLTIYRRQHEVAGRPDAGLHRVPDIPGGSPSLGTNGNANQ